MKCGECRFSLLCWSGRLGNGSGGIQNSMNLCPACGRFALHFLDCPSSLLLPGQETNGETPLLQHGEWRHRGSPIEFDELRPRLRRHFVFYCEQRYITEDEKRVWDTYYTQCGVKIVGYYNRAPLTAFHVVAEFIVPGPCEVRPCYPCARYTPKDINSLVLELEEPCAA